jgi:hypothetical protein
MGLVGLYLSLTQRGMAFVPRCLDMSQTAWQLCLKCASKQKISLHLLNKEVLFNIKSKLL